MKLIVISPPTSLKQETQLVSGMLKAGLQHFHLRKPEGSEHDFREYIQDLSTAERKSIVLHASHELVAEWSLKVGALR